MARTIQVRAKCIFLEEAWSFGVKGLQCSKVIECSTCGHKKLAHNIHLLGCLSGCPDYKKELEEK